MEIIWRSYPISAKDISIIASEETGWNKNTTYTIIKKLIDKNCIKRSEPNFICSSLVSRSSIQRNETDSLISKLFNGSRKAFFASFLQDEKLSDKELEEIKKMIDGK
jgi:predicted transcriptional regulator